MKCLACDEIRGYFFCSATKEELEEELIPLRETLMDECKELRYPLLFVSSEETMKKELIDQAKIKANPYCYKAHPFFEYTGVIPDADIYFVLNQKLNELYFVPFDIIYPSKWSNIQPWGAIDQFEFKHLSALASKTFTFDNGKERELPPVFTEDDRLELKNRIKKELASRGRSAVDVFAYVMPYFQDYHLHVEDIQEIFALTVCDVGMDFFRQDQLHMRTATSWFDDPHETDIKPRSYEEEEELCSDEWTYGFTPWQIEHRLLAEYLDGIITWDTLSKLYLNPGALKNYQSLKEPNRKQKVFENFDDIMNAPFEEDSKA